MHLFICSLFRRIFDFHCGSAVLYLGQLFETLQNEDLPDVEVPVNLQLSPQGALRVMVKVEI